MANIHDKIRAEVVENVVDMFEDSIATKYSDSNEGLNSAMFIIVEHALTEVFSAVQGPSFDDIQLACLIEPELIVKKIFNSVLSSTTFIVEMADIVRELHGKLFDDQRLKDMD